MYPHKNIFRKTSILILIISLLFGLAAYNNVVNGENNYVLEEELTVHYIELGQGDAILIQHNNNNMLIDGGDRWDWVADKLTSYLNE